MTFNFALVGNEHNSQFISDSCRQINLRPVRHLYSARRSYFHFSRMDYIQQPILFKYSARRHEGSGCVVRIINDRNVRRGVERQPACSTIPDPGDDASVAGALQIRLANISNLRDFTSRNHVDICGEGTTRFWSEGTSLRGLQLAATRNPGMLIPPCAGCSSSSIDAKRT
jgi:hypothetical protein